MEKRVDGGKIKGGLDRLLKYIPVRFPTTGWFFAGGIPSGSLMLENKRRRCIFSCLEKIFQGDPLCLSAEKIGCTGASCYLGFKMPSANAGYFLAEKERFKKNTDLGDAFYIAIDAEVPKTDYVILRALSDIDDALAVEVVNLWVDALSLAGLVTLANYDRDTNNNVVLPFASGCQSVWTIPYKERHEKEPKCVVGCIDPAMRRFLPSNTVSFSVPANRFVEMTANISGSFLEHNHWGCLVSAHRQPD